MGFVERFVHGTFGQRVFVLLCLGALVITGVAAFRDLPIEAFPDLTNNQVVVITEAPSLAAPEVEHFGEPGEAGGPEARAFAGPRDGPRTSSLCAPA